MVKFPAIAISEGNSFAVVKELHSSCNALGWRKGYFEGLSYFDSDGVLWPVLRACPAHQPTTVDRILNRRLSVSLELGQPLSDGWSKAIEKIFLLIDNDRDDLYNQFVSHSELKEQMREAKTPSQLIEVARSLGAR